MTSQPWPCTRAQQLCRALFEDLFGATGCATTLSRATAPFTPTFPRGGARAHSLHLELFWTSQLSCTPGSTGSALPGMSQPHVGRPRPSCGQCQGVSAPAWALPAVGSLSLGRNSRRAVGMPSLDQVWAVPRVLSQLQGCPWVTAPSDTSGAEPPLLGATSGPPSAGWVQPGWGFFGVALFCIFKPARRNTESTPGAV